MAGNAFQRAAYQIAHLCSTPESKDNDGSGLTIQVPAKPARRAEEGDTLSRGQRFGMIRFGSRVDLYLPRGYAAAARIGQQVFAGQSIVARRG